MKQELYILIGAVLVLLPVASGCTSSSIMHDAQSNDYHFVGQFHITYSVLVGQPDPTETVSFMLFYFDSDERTAGPDGTRLMTIYPNLFGLFAYILKDSGQWEKVTLVSRYRTKFLGATSGLGGSVVFLIVSPKHRIDVSSPLPSDPNRPYVMELRLEDGELKCVETDYWYNKFFRIKPLKATDLPVP